MQNAYQGCMQKIYLGGGGGGGEGHAPTFQDLVEGRLCYHTPAAHGNFAWRGGGQIHSSLCR